MKVPSASKMRDPKLLLFIDLLAAGLVAWDLSHTLRSGRARGRNGTITRAHQPARFWRYVYSACILLAFLAASFLWVLIWPDSLG